ADELDRVGRRAAPADQVADRQATQRVSHDAWHAVGDDQVAGRGAAGGDRGLDVHAEVAVRARGPRLESVVADELLAQRLRRRVPADAVLLDLRQRLLGALQVGLQLALLHQQFVDLRAGFFG